MRESEDWAKNASKDWLKMQSELEPARKTAKNPHFNSEYSDLEEVFRVGKKALLANNFCFAQFPTTKDGHVFITTKYWHTSGAWLESDGLGLKPLDLTPQKVGSCVTYGRRYDFQSTIGSESKDDDGHDASNRQWQEKSPQQTEGPNQGVGNASLEAHRQAQPKPEAKKPFVPKPGYDVNKDDRPPTEPQIKRLFALSKAGGWPEEDIKQYMKDVWNVDSYNKITRGQYQVLIDLVSVPKEVPVPDIDNLEMPFSS